MRRVATLASCLFAGAVLLFACTAAGDPPAPSTAGADSLEATGVVVALDGGLEAVDSFTIVLSDGSELTLIPEPDLLFEGGPLSHLRDHLLSGTPVGVVYSIDAEGNAIAHRVGDE
jgi:hypothetical protein